LADNQHQRTTDTPAKAVMSALPESSDASSWPWPASLDALVAAPRHHTLLLETDRVRVLETHVPAGEVVPVHTHRWPSVLYVLSRSDFVRRDADGHVLLDSRGSASARAGRAVIWSEPLAPHSLENVGTMEIRVISVELKECCA
jgi:hypothetical protein